MRPFQSFWLPVRVFVLVFLTASLAPGGARAMDCLQKQQRYDIAGGLIGGLLGGFLGHALSPHAAATALGAAGGAAAGAVVVSQAAHCGQDQYGYYEEGGRWVSYRETSKSYQGPDGHWIVKPREGAGPEATEPGEAPGGMPFAADGGQSPAAMFAVDAKDVRSEEMTISSRIENAMADASLDQRIGAKDLRRLDDIRRLDDAYRDENDHLSQSQKADILERLNALSRTLAAQLRAARDGA